MDLRKSITEKTRRVRHGRDGVFDLLGVVPVPFLHWDKTAQRIGLQIANIALYGDIAEFVTIALFHHIGDDEVPLVRRQFSNRGNDAKIGITLSERSEEHTSELQSLMRISYAVFCLKKKKKTKTKHKHK